MKNIDWYGFVKVSTGEVSMAHWLESSKIYFLSFYANDHGFESHHQQAKKILTDWKPVINVRVDPKIIQVKPRIQRLVGQSHEQLVCLKCMEVREPHPGPR